ncbi:MULTISPECIES: protein kinase [unclassified Nonomuraea]|uniref:serine/threonine-protein kinase n=1 Tax=unclassified Nonomuraea TaxID=2593643 RepID=UPI0033C7C798
MSDSAVMVGGRYRLLRTIGQGGMGTVWHAHDEVLGRDVAVKEVHPPPDLNGPERDVFSVRTFREARAAGRVAHPGVAAVYDVLEEGGHPWIVMQLVRSRTLGELVREEGPLPPARVADIGLQLLEALRAAHTAGVLHRDVKPDNVLLTEDGRAVLTDFGIATTEDEAPVTRTGILVGTPAFMAPERAAGGQAVAESDLWSLGVTLYLAVEGQSPFQRAHALATLGAVMHSEPPPLARAGALGPVLLGLLRKDPAQRMSLDEARWRLHAVVAGNAPEPTAPVAIPAGGLSDPGPSSMSDTPAVPVAGAAPVASSRPPAGPPGGPAAGPSSAAFHPAVRRRRPPLSALVAGAAAVAVLTGGAAWWTNRPVGDTRTPSTAPAVVSSAIPSKPASEPVSHPATSAPSDPPTDSGPRQGTIPTDGPASHRPTAEPSRHRPTTEPTGRATREPTKKPTTKPTTKPTKKPSTKPTAKPTAKATKKPTPAKSKTEDEQPSARTPGQVDPVGSGRSAGTTKKPKKAKSGKA